MNGSEAQLSQLVVEVCQYPPGSPQRQQHLTRMIRIITPRLWRETTVYYGDALQQTWVYFCQNLCNRYDPTRSSVTTWLNYYLRRRLQDFYIETQKQQAKRAHPLASTETYDASDPLDTIAAPADVPPILEQVRTWAEANEELRQIHLEGRPEINGQVLILRRLPPETSWKALADEFGVAIPTLSSFYRRQCMPRLRNFGESEGYL